LHKSKFILTNHCFQNMFGYSIKETTRKDFNFIKLVSPESLPYINKRQQLLKLDRPLPLTYRFIAQHKNGSKIHVETHVTYFKFEGEKTVLGIIRDISKERNLNISDLKHLISSSTCSFNELLVSIFFKINKIFNFYSGGVFAVVNGKINHLHLSNLQQKEVIAFNLSRKVLKEVLNGQEKRINDEEHSDQLGLLTMFDPTITDSIFFPILADGNVIAGLYIFERSPINIDSYSIDIIRLGCLDLGQKYEAIEKSAELLKKQAALKLEHSEALVANEKQRRLLLDLQHEIITPINAIMGHVSFFQDHYNEIDHDLKKLMLRDILSESERLILLFRDIESLSIITQNNLTPVYLFEKIIFKHIAFYRNLCQGKNIVVKVEGKFNIPKLNIDVHKFDVIISNLIRNIYKYSYDNSEAIIDASDIDPLYYYLDFKNSGVGIPQGEELIIFDEGVRGTNTLVSEPPIPGNGIGLYLVRLFLKQHNSDIKVIRNSNPTIFRVSLSKSLEFIEKRNEKESTNRR